jgi:hypothetical protein
MRENRLYGSEGGEPANPASLPLSIDRVNARHQHETLTNTASKSIQSAKFTQLPETACR